jgi:hypothetical protein
MCKGSRHCKQDSQYNSHRGCSHIHTWKVLLEKNPSYAYYHNDICIDLVIFNIISQF